MSADLATRLNAEAAADAAPLFVINLCASTSPMALTHPNTAELKRFTFFVSRQREEGRERFRLHMGYFASQEDAESLLAAVRDVYPAAWAGPAPTSGVPRRARMSVSPKVTVAQPVAQPVSPPAAAVAATIAAPPALAPQKPEPVEPASLEAMSNVRDVLAQLSEEVPAARQAVPVAHPADTKGAIAATVTPRAVSELNASQTLQVLEAPTPAAAAPAVRTTPAPAVPVAPVVPAALAVPVAVPKVAPPVARGPVPAPARVPPTTRVAAPEAGESEVRLVTPEDTQTLTDIKLDAQNNAPPCFAVQLVWAVAPIDVATLPHLAIFDAYTLYNVEGSRQGRKWFGLRLGFFSDPNSATQVAHYVRSDYPAVAIVPVATRERDHAKGGTIAAAPRAEAVAPPQRPDNSLAIEKQGLDGFELLQDDVPRAAKRDVDDIVPQQAAAAPAAPAMTAREKIAAATASKPLAKPAAPAVQVAKPVAGKAVGKPVGKRVVVRKRPQPPQAASHRGAPGSPNPLESTLEILGASTLTLDESREIVNDSAIRKPIEKKPASSFSKLLSRLSGG